MAASGQTSEAQISRSGLRLSFVAGVSWGFSWPQEVLGETEKLCGHRPTRSNPLTARVSGNAFSGITFQLTDYRLGPEPSSRKLGLTNENLGCPWEEWAAGEATGRSCAEAREEHGAGRAAA